MQRFVRFWSNMQPFHAILFTPKEGGRKWAVMMMEGQNRELIQTMPAALTASKPRTEKFPQLWMYRPSQSLLTNPSTTCVTQPKGHGGDFVSMQLIRVCFSCYAKVRANRDRPLSPSGSHRFNDLSMLAWSIHCDEERVRAKRIIPFSRSRSPSIGLCWSICWRSKARESAQVDVTSGLGH